MRRFLKVTLDKYLNAKLDFRVRLFNVLAMAGVLISVFMLINAVIAGSDIVNVLACLVSCAVSYALLVYARKSGKYKRCYILTITMIFLVLFPIMFFSAGGYHSGMPSFFIFAVGFTVFMLEGKAAVLFSILEAVIYVAVCLVAYQYPQLVNFYETEAAFLQDVIVGFLVVSAALGTSFYLHFKLYNEQQRQLAEQNATLNQINQQKTIFLSNISHELKTPLTVISGHVQIAQKELGNSLETEALRKTMKLIDSEAERMALMVTQLLDASRIEEGRMRIEPCGENIVEIIQLTLDTYYPTFAKNRNRLEFNCAEDIPTLSCDRTRIIQVLVNLIGNASRHTHNGVIAVSAAVQGEDVIITVSDNGEGISPKQMPTLFQRYSSYRSGDDKNKTGGNTGTGLGLYICKFIVEAHNGRIWLESELGVGTRACFTLPLGT